MRKKVFILVTLILFISSGTLFAKTGIGAAFGYGRGGSNVALSLDVAGIPGSVQTIKLRFDSNYFGLGFADDWYLIDNTFAGPFGIYLGLGFYTNLRFGNDYFYSALGARAPIGLDVTLFKNHLVLFIEAAPILGLQITPSFNFPNWDVLGSLGFRFYF